MALRLMWARYYVLVAACIFARKVDWLRNACLAAALLFPVIAALHGIVLATVHIDGEPLTKIRVFLSDSSQGPSIWIFTALSNFAPSPYSSPL